MWLDTPLVIASPAPSISAFKSTSTLKSSFLSSLAWREASSIWPMSPAQCLSTGRPKKSSTYARLCAFSQGMALTLGSMLTPSSYTYQSGSRNPISWGNPTMNNSSLNIRSVFSSRQRISLIMWLTHDFPASLLKCPSLGAGAGYGCTTTTRNPTIRSTTRRRLSIRLVASLELAGNNPQQR